MINLDDHTTDADEMNAVGTALRQLAFYADQKAAAMRARERGDIKQAQLHEGCCASVYRQLPDWAKW